MTHQSVIQAGAACVDITPAGSVFLFGYPHVRRHSTGVHDPLLCSAIYFADDRTRILLISCDVIWIPKALALAARQRIERKTGIPASHILIAGTHTHSGPITSDVLSNEIDPIVPKVDPAYLTRLEDGIVQAAERAAVATGPAEVAMVIADGSPVGTNRRNPSGPRDPQVPVMLVRRPNGTAVGALLICSMHPTVLHEDSTLISGDFPAATREYLQRHLLSSEAPVVYFTGPCGNLSPRHVTRANTFAEAWRLGELLGKSVQKAADSAIYCQSIDLAVGGAHVVLPRRTMPSVAQAKAKLDRAIERLAELRRRQADPREIRTAECDWFGAEETMGLALAAQDGRLAAAADAVMPAEIQVFRLGAWRLVGWPCEIFVEYSLELKKRCPDTFVISLANGDLQGYLVTPEAAEEGGYEASNAIFAPAGGAMLVGETERLIAATPALRRTA